MFDLPAAAPLDIRDLLVSLLLTPEQAYRALARLTPRQRAMQALCVAAALDMDDAALLARWEAQFPGPAGAGGARR